MGRVECTILPAQPADAVAIATLHVESWRSAYRGLLPDAFLDGAVVEDRMNLWRERLNGAAADRQLVLKAISRGALAGFVCVRLDDAPAHGPRLDNLHVRPELKGTGIGSSVISCRARLGRPASAWTTHAPVGHRRQRPRAPLLRPSRGCGC